MIILQRYGRGKRSLKKKKGVPERVNDDRDDDGLPQLLRPSALSRDVRRRRTKIARLDES